MSMSYWFSVTLTWPIIENCFRQEGSVTWLTFENCLKTKFLLPSWRSSHRRCSAKSTGKHLCMSLLFNKFAGLRKKTPAEKKRLRQMCSSVNFVIKFENTFFIEHLRWLLLKLVPLWFKKEQETLRVVTIATIYSTSASRWKFQYFRRPTYNPVEHLWWSFYWENSKPLSILPKKALS